MLLPTSLPLLLSLLNLARTCIEFLCYLFLLRIFVFFVLDLCVFVCLCVCRVVFGFRHKPENSFAERVSARVSAAVSARVSNGIFVRTTFHNFQLEVSK